MNLLYFIPRRENIVQKLQFLMTTQTSNSLRLPKQSFESNNIIVPDVYIHLSHLTVAISAENSSQTSKIVLDDISAIFKPGQVSALMGVSGSGKTTLLNAIAKRISHAKLSGEIRANNSEYEMNQFGNFGHYLMQSDILCEVLTVRETLEFAINLRVHQREEVKKQLMQRLISKLMLYKCIDTVIGGMFVKGISGGEKKRVSLALELIGNPRVLLLDEPTSGLDSLTSQIIINFLQDLAYSQAMTIILSIHQPSCSIFSKFDKLVLLANGKMIYQGDAASSVQYFQHQSWRECSQYQNSADYLISIMHHLSQEDNLPQLLHHQTSFQSTLLPNISLQIQAIPTNHLQNLEKERASFWLELMVLLVRQFRNNLRNPKLLKARVVQMTFNVIFLSGLFFNNGRQSYVDSTYWSAMLGLSYFLSYGPVMLGMLQTVLTFPADRQLFLKEENSKLYSLLMYFFSKNIVQIPFLLVAPLVGIPIIYFAAHLGPTPTQYFTLNLISFSGFFVGDALGLIIGSLTTDAKEATSKLIPFFIAPVVLFSGLFKNRATYGAGVGWMEYLSPIKYVLNAVIMNEVADRESNVSQLNLNLTLWESVGYTFVLGFIFRLIALVILWLKKGKLQ